MGDRTWARQGLDAGRKEITGMETFRMKRRHMLLGALGAVAALSPLGALAQSGEITKPQPELPKQKLIIVTRDGVQHDFEVEMALTPEQQTVGEMFRTSVPANGGMLFDWGSVRDESHMWMKQHDQLPLDMVFINNERHGSAAIAENTTPQQPGH